jgi:glycosyltransferase involved in cell wall biosynthesis
MPEIKVTVLMPVYNGAKYIAEAIGSVLAQSFGDFELLIMDDGSTDNTVAEIRKFNDPRIRLVECAHLGFATTLNNGLKQAKAELVARLDADDLCKPERLATQYDFMQANPEYILIGSEEDYIDMNGEYLFTLQCPGYSDAEIRDLDPTTCPFSHTSVMYKKEEVIQAGGYYLHGHSFEDHMLWLKLIKKGKVCNLPQSLVKYRFNPGSMTIDEKWRGKRFLRLKATLLIRGYATEKENEELTAIMKSQDNNSIKEGAYYALCGKKFLFNNYKPTKARTNLGKAIRHRPSRLDNYALYMLSFFPRPFLHWLYRKNKTA